MDCDSKMLSPLEVACRKLALSGDKTIWRMDLSNFWPRRGDRATKRTRRGL